MARGGRRQPKPGGLYPNRSDMAAGPTPQPIRTAPNQQYGMATDQQQAQQAIPLPNNSVPTPPPSNNAGIPRVAPGSLTPLTAPTARPNEPITAGASFGAGPGPTNPAGASTLPDTLNRIASQPGAPPEVAALASYVNSGRR